MDGRGAPRRRLLGLDSIRFVCAVWVFFFHSSWLMSQAERPDGTLIGIHTWRSSLIDDIFNGPAAVIVFFVISGLVVHYPNIGRKPDLYSHFVRRFVRVGGPILFLFVAIHLFTKTMKLYDLPVWSLWCELIYYALYPAILAAKDRVGLLPIMGVSFAAAFVLAMMPSDAPIPLAFSARGDLLNWILGLPTWLLGMFIAEHINDNRASVSRRTVWIMRVGIVVLAAATNPLHYQAFVSEQIYLVLFAIPVAVWLVAEVEYASVRPPWAWLERQGKWSYSLYLVHMIAIAVIVAVVPNTYFINHPIAVWLTCIALGLVMARAFFSLVESPFHWLARALSRLRPPAMKVEGAV